MGALLILVFLVVPVLELWVILAVGQRIGALPTVLALLGISVAGAWLVKREGLKAWRRFRAVVEQGGIPAEEVVDGALLLLGGALMLTPGFLTDAVGLALVVPLPRRWLNRGLRSRVRGMFGLGPARRSRSRTRAPTTGDTEVVDVEVVDVRRDGDGQGPTGELDS